jgi:hypothetical protein
MNSSPPIQPLPSSSDVADIEAVILDYAEGRYAGDVSRMDRALHSDLVKRTPGDPSTPTEEALRMVSKARMVELTAGGGGEIDDPELEVVVEDVSANVASARVLTPEYLDYLHLVKTPVGWKIANILFRLRE